MHKKVFKFKDPDDKLEPEVHSEKPVQQTVNQNFYCSSRIFAKCHTVVVNKCVLLQFSIFLKSFFALFKFLVSLTFWGKFNSLQNWVVYKRARGRRSSGE